MMANSSPPKRASVSVARRSSFEPARDLLDQLVAGRMAVGVVDVLEAVEVEEHHREPAAGAADPAELLVEPLAEEQAVRQPRERVAAERGSGHAPGSSARSRAIQRM